MLEQVVRPFQTPGAIVSRQVSSKRIKKQREIARLLWGDTGSLPQPHKVPDDTSGGYNFKLKDDCADTYSEGKRNTSKIRVENPDDSSQYVMVERIDSMSFQKKPTNKSTATGTETTDFVSVVDTEIKAAFDDLKNQICDVEMKFKNS